MEMLWQPISRLAGVFWNCYKRVPLYRGAPYGTRKDILTRFKSLRKLGGRRLGHGTEPQFSVRTASESVPAYGGAKATRVAEDG